MTAVRLCTKSAVFELKVGGKSYFWCKAVQVANAAGGGGVDLTPGETIITYMDANQSLTLATADITVTALGSADTDKLVEPGEMYEIKITGLVAALTTDLKKDTEFTIQIKPAQGAVVNLGRRTPVFLEKINDMG